MLKIMKLGGKLEMSEQISVLVEDGVLGRDAVVVKSNSAASPKGISQIFNNPSPA